jgi:hypothetical protein
MSILGRYERATERNACYRVEPRRNGEPDISREVERIEGAVVDGQLV